MYKKFLAAILCISFLEISFASASEEYQKCISQNDMPDFALKQCVITETVRVEKIIKNTLQKLATSPYYANWKVYKQSPQNEIKTMFSEWEAYASTFCSFLAYADTQGEGTLYSLGSTSCFLGEANRFLNKINFINKTYEKK